MTRLVRAATAGLAAVGLACPVALASTTAPTSPDAAPPATAASSAPSVSGSASGSATPTASASATAAPTQPPVEPAGSPVLQPVQPVSHLDPQKIAQRVKAEVGDERLKEVSVVVRDGLTGDTLFEQSPDRAQRPASTAKLLTALAVVGSADTSRRFETRVVTGGKDGEIVLVAGGDQMLAEGKGNDTAVAGHAGLADLAAQVATRLEEQGRTSASLRLDDSWAKGPLEPSAWEDVDTADGWAGRITMLGLNSDRALPFEPQSADPAATATVAFAKALTKAGVTVTGADGPGQVTRAKAPAGATELGAVESATLGETLSLGLLESDNAILESMARIAAVERGVSPDPTKVSQWVVQQVRAAGIDTKGVTLEDTSGLARQQTVPARVVADILTRASTGADPELRDVLSRLPVGGLTGTLNERYLVDSTRDGAGIVRAKTGSLPEASALAGSLVTNDGDLLTFTIFTQGYPTGASSMTARTAIDEITTALVHCGCEQG